MNFDKFCAIGPPTSVIVCPFRSLIEDQEQQLRQIEVSVAKCMLDTGKCARHGENTSEFYLPYMHAYTLLAHSAREEMVAILRTNFLLFSFHKQEALSLCDG